MLMPPQRPTRAESILLDHCSEVCREPYLPRTAPQAFLALSSTMEETASSGHVNFPSATVNVYLSVVERAQWLCLSLLAPSEVALDEAMPTAHVVKLGGKHQARV